VLQWEKDWMQPLHGVRSSAFSTELDADSACRRLRPASQRTLRCYSMLRGSATFFEQVV
jgi:hypothetical protein